MKKTFLLHIFLLVSPFLMDAQIWQWAKSCPNSNGSGVGDGTSVCTDTNGNVFITGEYSGAIIAGSYTLTCQSTYPRSYLIKYDSSGNVLWARTVVATGGGVGYDQSYSVCTDNGGNAYITGRFSDSTIVFGTYTLTNTGGFFNTFLVKYDSNGNVLWAKQSSNTGGHACAYSISSDGNNNAYISGVFSSPSIVFGTYTLTNANSNSMLFLVKYDPNGNVIWAKTAPGDASSDNNGFGVSVSAEANGNTFVSGAFTGPAIVFGTYTLSTTSKNIFIVKYDPNGNVLWARSVSGSSLDMAYSVSADGSGNGYIAGYISSPSLIFGTFTLTNTGQNAFLAKYDSNGNVLWVRKSVGGHPGYPGTCGLSVSSNSCGVFMTGSLNNTITLGSQTLSPPAGSFDPAFITRYDGSGNIIFAQAIVSGGDDWLALSLDKFSNAYVTGDFAVNNFAVGTSTLIKTGSENTFLAKLSYTNCQIPDGTNEFSMQNKNTRLFPNPNSGQFKIQIEEEIENAEIIILNSLYQKIYSQIVVRGENEINFKKFASGIYYYSITQNNQTLRSGKISIE